MRGGLFVCAILLLACGLVCGYEGGVALFDRLYVYRCPPVDFWFGWLRLRVGEDFVFDVLDEPGGLFEREWLSGSEGAIRELLSVSSDGFLRAGWEGDVRDGCWQLSGFPLPETPGDPGFLVAVKQNNNGTTFISSPVSLQHLQEYYACRLEYTAFV